MTTANNICFDIATLGHQHSTIYKSRLIHMIEHDREYNPDEENKFLKKHLKLPCDCGGIDNVHHLYINRNDLKNKKIGNASFIGSYCNIRGSHFLKNPKHKQLKNLKSEMRTDINKPYLVIENLLGRVAPPLKGRSSAKHFMANGPYRVELFGFNEDVAVIITDMGPITSQASICSNACNTQITTRCPDSKNRYGPDKQFKSRCDCINYNYYDNPNYKGCEKCAHEYCCGNIDGCNTDPFP